MNIQEINQLTKASVAKLTSDAYLAAFNDEQTGKIFAQKINDLENAPKSAPTPRPNGRVRADEPAVAPTPGFDPSFDDSPNPPAAQPATETQPAVAEPSIELPEKIHRYQPVDHNGRAVGGEQVFKYRTDAELIEKLTKAHSASSARIRELSRDRKLEEIATAGPTEKNFVPSTEVPKTIEELSRELLEQRQQNFLLSVREALNNWQLGNPEWAEKYRANPENAKSLVLAISRAGDDPSDPASYQRAFVAMKDFLEPVVAAEPIAAPAPVPVVAAPAPAVASTPTHHAVGVASGLSDANAFNGPDPFEVQPKVKGMKLVIDGKTVVMDLRTWDRQGSDFQKRALRNPNNATIVNQMYDEQAAQQLARR
jgi:hypothetical protein